MVRYNNDLDEYESYYHIEEPSPRHLPPRSYRSGHPSRPSRPHREDPVFPALGHAASSAVGSALANFATYPLDVISTRLKVQRYALAQRAARSRARKKKYLSDSSLSSSDDNVHGILNVSKAEKKTFRKYEQETESGTRITETWEYDEDELYDGHFDAARKIYEREGIGGFYHGVGWDTLGTVAGGFWYFMAYNLLRKQRLHILGDQNPHIQLPIMEELGIGIAAAALSKFVAAPMSNIVTRKQTAAMLYPNAKTPSFASIYQDIMREKGVSGFWSGYKASLLLTLNPSITFLLYEKIKPHMLEHKGSMDKMDIFLLAALCKAAATTLTYPMNIIRIRSEMDESNEEAGVAWGPMGSGSKGTHTERGRERHDHLSHSRYRRTIRQASGIVGLLSEIVRREGISALYVGLGGALFKGFFTHGVTMMIKEHVHRFILTLYFFVLEAYNNSEHGSFREKALEKTLSGAHKTGHAVAAGKRKIESAKDKVEHFKETVKEKVNIGQHSSNHSHSDRHRLREHSIEGASFREEGRGSFRGRSDEEEMFEEHFSTPRERTGRTVIREERVTNGPSRLFEEERLAISSSRERGAEITGAHHNRSRSFREEHITRSAPPPPPAPALRSQGANRSTAVAISGSLVGTPPVPTGKTMEKVANWRDNVAEEMAAAKENALKSEHALVTTKHEMLEGAYGETIDRTTTVKETSFDHTPQHIHRHRQQSFISRDREPSLASGQSYRSAGARTSLVVHPPSSVRERITGRNEEWVEDSRLVGKMGGRHMMGGGDIGVNGEVRKSSEGKGWK